MDTLLQDLRYAGRILLGARGFAAIAIVTLALGIGGTTAIYSVVNAVLLQPLPFPEAERVVVPRSVDLKSGDDWSISFADFIDWRDGKVFEHVAAYQQFDMDLAAGGDPERVNVVAATGDFFAVLGVRPMLGRVLQPTDNPLDAPRVIVLSEELWRTRFGSDSAVIGREVRMNSVPRVVVGVMPRGTEWPQGARLWVPLRTDPNSEGNQRRDNFVYQGVARLATGETIASTNVRLAALAKRIEAEHPRLRADISLKVITASESLLGTTVPRALWIMLGAVGLVLLIGCVNIANLMLARASTRHRELALRTALGASRTRIVRQILTESAVLAFAGGMLGILLAYWGVAAFIVTAPADLPRVDEVSVSIPVLGIALLLSLASAVVFGLVPALQASAVRPGQALGEGGYRMAGGKASRRGRGMLVIVELALALMLLAGAGLLIHSLIKLQRTDPGFETGRVTTMSITLPGDRYDPRAARMAFYGQTMEQIAALPGVDTVSMASALPIGAGGFYLGRAFLAEGWAEPPASKEVEGMWNSVSPGYFGTLGLPLLRGRDFTPRDDSAAAPVMIISSAFAAKMFPGENAIGKRVQSWRDERVLREVVGVVDDVRYFGAEDEVRPLVFVPYAQDTWAGMRIVVRTEGDPSAIVSGARRIVSALDRDVAVADVATMDQAMAASLAAPRFTTILLAGFAAVALLLVAIGLYGVLSYSIAQRTHEIGIRMALGAQVSAVRRMVIREAGVLIVLGIAIGGAGALALSKVMESLLYEVSATDPITFVSVVVVLAAVGAAAAYVPARRATRVDPLIALRSGD